jgi:CRISPR-associated protein Cas1
VIPKSYGYKGKKTKRPPKDLLNAAISYGYGYLQYFVQRELMLQGLNPYHGFLHHQEDKTRPFLVFDLMGGLRHSFGDSTVITLSSRKQLKTDKHAKRAREGILLNRRGIKLLSKTLHETRTDKSRYKISSNVIFLFTNIFTLYKHYWKNFLLNYII